MREAEKLAVRAQERVGGELFSSSRTVTGGGWSRFTSLLRRGGAVFLLLDGVVVVVGGIIISARFLRLYRRLFWMR